MRIRSGDPSVRPELRFNYLTTERDRREWIEAVRCARDILGQPAFADLDGGEVSPGPARRMCRARSPPCGRNGAGCCCSFFRSTAPRPQQQPPQSSPPEATTAAAEATFRKMLSSLKK